MSDTLIQILEYLGIFSGGALSLKFLDWLLIKFKVKNAKTESTSKEFESYTGDVNKFMEQMSLMTDHLSKARELVIHKDLELLTSNSKNKAILEAMRRHAIVCSTSEHDLITEIELIEKTYSNE